MIQMLMTLWLFWYWDAECSYWCKSCGQGFWWGFSFVCHIPLLYVVICCTVLDSWNMFYQELLESTQWIQGLSLRVEMFVLR
jgi:hypothetical protein